MTFHGASPRSAKRRKTDHPEPPESALTPQAAQTLKNAVLGPFSPYGYNAQSPRSTTQDYMADSPEAVTSIDAGTEPDAMSIDRFTDSAYQSTSAREERAQEGSDIVETPSKSKRSQRAEARQPTTEVDTTIDNGVRITATPSKRKRRKYRAHSGSSLEHPSTRGDRLEGSQGDYGVHGADGGDASLIGVGRAGGSSEAGKKLETRVLDVGVEYGEADSRMTDLQRHGELNVKMQSGVEENKSDNQDSANHQGGRSSGRQRRKPRRYSTEMAESITLQLPPILSFERPRGRKKKTSAVVTVAEPEVELEHPSTASSGDPRGQKKKKATVVTVAEPEAEHERSSTASPRDPRNRKRKASAVFTVAESEDELHLGFKDIPTNADFLEAVQPVEVPRLDPLPPKKALQVDEVAITPTKKRGRPPKALSVAPSTPRGPQILSTGQPILVDGSRASLSDHYESLRTILQEEGGEGALLALKTHVLEGLTGKRRLPLMGLEAEYEKVHQLVEQTVVAGEGNSMLVIGARGTAKTNLVETVLSDLAALHREDFYVVRLNGFVHTDDKLALREIWRQLGREMEVEDDTMGTRSNYADTLASLLALLSHPAELAEVNADQAAKSVIFIMDEFDLFTTHPRQTLLYNLFDIAQARKAPIAVLGLTTRVDVVESLEKRVKSRFSHRYVHLSLPKSFPAFQDICKAALMVLDPLWKPDLSLTESLPRDPHFSKLQSAWNHYISSLFSNSTQLTNYILRTYHLSKSIPSFLSTSLIPLASLSTTCIPTCASFISDPLTPPDSKLQLLPGLSDLSLSLLIAAARLDIILDTDVCNFNMAYDEYQQMASRVKVQSSAAGAMAVGAGSKVWGKEVAMAAWERLMDLELVMPAVGTGSGVGGGSGNGGGGRAGRMWRVDVGLEEIAPSVPGLSAVMARWCREI